ncbi:MAG: hypothetical protein OHK93_004683 [Ramalina farinacea]|uniref:Zn(2)-C6 fungal-type domain-containing protein n=1 Tax=Ramalina farinacea TaxID=258253 RepID=A0AA43U0J5_9LECA|nr:hypothetical protein [Ramalina farinacea]
MPISEHAANSSGEPAFTTPTPRPSTRGACDRCRGQKLRCLRNEQSQDDPKAPCMRCFKAGADCCYGIARRAGRPSAPQAQALPQQHKKGIRGGKATATGMTSSDTSLITDSQDCINLFDQETSGRRDSRIFGLRAGDRLSHENSDCTVDQGSEAESECRSRASINDPNNTPYSTTSDLLRSYFNGSLSWPDEDLSLLGNQDAGKAHGFEPFESSSGWTFNSEQVQPMDVEMQTAFPLPAVENSNNGEVSAYRTPPQPHPNINSMSKAFEEAIPSDSLTRAAQIDPSSPRNAIDDASLLEQIQERSRIMKGSTSSLNSEMTPITELQHQRMRELSDLAMDLYAQLAIHNPDRHDQSVPKSPAFHAQLVGYVLKSSNTFLALLKSFCSSVTSSTSSSSSSYHRSPITPRTASSTNQQNSPNNSSYSGTDGASPSTLAMYEREDFVMDDELGYSAPNDGSKGSSASESSQPTDMTTVLQLLTCYLRIVQLHSIMHNLFYDYLLAYFPPATSQSSPSVLHRQPRHLPVAIPPVFPGLQIGGVSLDPFGTFQVKFLLQISMQVLGEIELALELPEEYVLIGPRKSGRSDSRGGGLGLLEASVTGGFVERVMKERECRGQRVGVVRERLGKLRSVLRGAVGGE